MPRGAGPVRHDCAIYLVSLRTKKLGIPQHIAYPGPLCYNANPEVPTVQFGRKTRNLAAASRRFFGERPNQAEPALGLNPGTTHVLEEEENAMTPPPQEESMVAGDPTQRLLTALGRFQRQVSRAEEGAPQEAWCDECMNQLITGIEIALNEDWADVKEALTDVARILQTYEDVGRADESIYFLKDSYEILCLMVGDLIVGNVRSGVMKKWQDRYERALDELGDAGLTLVDDESPGGGAAHERGWSDPDATTMGLDSGDDFDDFIEEQAGAISSPAFDNAPEPAPRSQGFPADPDDPFAPLDLDTVDGSPFGAPASAAATTDLPSLDDLLGRPVADTDDLEEESSAAGLDLSEDFTAESDHIGYGLLEDETETAPANVPEERLEIQDAVVELESTEAPAPMPEPEPELALDLEPEPEPEPQAAAELEPEPEPAPAPAPAPARVEPRAAAPAPEPEPAPGSPEALFRTAQQAMAQGNLADAKVFALQLAVNMAKMEADQVAGRIALIEADIAQNAQSIATGEHAVSEAEFRVLQLEEQVTICQREFDSKREEIGRLRDEVAGVEGGVAELNRQIEELIARRDEEVRRLAQCQQNLDDNLSEESRMQSELEALSEEEAGSRENLDGARDHVLILKQTGEAHAGYLRAAQAELEVRRTAVADIERTIQQVSGVTPETDGAASTESNEQSAEGDGNTAGDGSSQA